MRNWGYYVVLRVWLGVDWVDVVPREITGRSELLTAGRLGCARARWQSVKGLN